MKKIPLTQSKVAFVDDEDFEYLNQWRWQNSNGYAKRTQHISGSGKDRIREEIRMHRVIMDAPPDKEVDHINHNPLDNQKSNLRLCTHKENSHNMRPSTRNTSGYRGVYFQKQNKKWVAFINLNNRMRYLGSFLNIKEALEVRKQAERKHYGEFALY